MLKHAINPILNPIRSLAGIESELQTLPNLPADRVMRTKSTARREFVDARRGELAQASIHTLPAPDEAVHMVVCGKFSLWDMVPAVLDLAGCDVAELTIATLGFSKRNVDAIGNLLDTGHVKHASLLCSHYFAKTSAEIYDHAQAKLSRAGTRFLSVRTHAKLLLIELVDGRTVTIESSANVRSCKNLEQVTLIGCPRVYDFHRSWIDSLFTEAKL